MFDLLVEFLRNNIITNICGDRGHKKANTRENLAKKCLFFRICVFFTNATKLRILPNKCTIMSCFLYVTDVK